MAFPDPGDGGVIIIKGGSVEIHFNDTVFPEDAPEANKRKHKQTRLRIKRIAIAGEFEKDFPNGFTGEIRITCKP